MKNLLGFTTYPVKHPVHGGQRRVHAFGEHYSKLGYQFEMACIFEKNIYSSQNVEKHDLPLEYFNSEYSRLPLVGDLLSGLYAASQPNIVDHFSRLVIEKKPQAITLEQPFMWPLVKKLREHAEIKDIPLIYSSQNWEPPLKERMLLSSGIDQKDAALASKAIESIERELVEESALIFAVSDADAKVYRALAPGKTVMVLRNGVARPAAGSAPMPRDLRDRRYFFFVGSAYPPNIDGICSLLLEGGLFFVPPEKTFAICGGVSHGIFNDRRYQQFLAANSERIQFFAKIDDDELSVIKNSAHAFLLPIDFGGGSNLKTAEALASGKWVVATPTSMRGFEEFADQRGVIIADGRSNFRKAAMEVYRQPPLQLTATEKSRRDSLYWDRCFDSLTSKRFAQVLRPGK